MDCLKLHLSNCVHFLSVIQTAAASLLPSELTTTRNTLLLLTFCGGYRNSACCRLNGSCQRAVGSFTKEAARPAGPEVDIEQANEFPNGLGCESQSHWGSAPGGD